LPPKQNKKTRRRRKTHRQGETPKSGTETHILQGGRVEFSGCLVHGKCKTPRKSKRKEGRVVVEPTTTSNGIGGQSVPDDQGQLNTTTQQTPRAGDKTGRRQAGHGMSGHQWVEVPIRKGQNHPGKARGMRKKSAGAKARVSASTGGV